jgi:hypothetical protein
MGDLICPTRHVNLHHVSRTPAVIFSSQNSGFVWVKPQDPTALLPGKCIWYPLHSTVGGSAEPVWNLQRLWGIEPLFLSLPARSLVYRPSYVGSHYKTCTMIRSTIGRNVYFVVLFTMQTVIGNTPFPKKRTTDDTTEIQTWNLLCTSPQRHRYTNPCSGGTGN